MKPLPILLILLTGNLFYSYADGLKINAEDTYIQLSPDGKGFDLYIRAFEGLGSVMITESTADPLKQSHSYTLRSKTWNPVNGDEKRILNGEFLVSEQPLYFLLDSTAQSDEILGKAYKIFIPFEITYGYPWSRQGQLVVNKDTWINIRSFEKPYADYSGSWQDNPFLISLKEFPILPQNIKKEEPIQHEKVDNVEQAVDEISKIISQRKGSVDVVLVVDTTISMKDNINFIRKSLVPLVRSQIDQFEKFRVGLVFYRDYKEAYLTRSIPFTDNLDTIQFALNRVTTHGGRDIEEAVNEGIFAALTEFEWEAPERIIIQVGDAPPHPEPKGAITEQLVLQEAVSKGISIFPINLPANTKAN